MSAVELVGLHKSFGGITAVNDVNLSIEDGEFISFLGPSGCGKSTLLNIVAGLDEPTAGTILFDGRDVSRDLPKDRGIAMVFQDYALYPHMTISQNLAFPLKALETPSAQAGRIIAEIAQSLNITELLQRRPSELSGGQRQRVALGRALVRNPTVFLMDEPLSNLDAKLRVQMRAELKRLKQNLGKTTIYVTHDQTEAMTLSDRIAVFEAGVLQQVDTPFDIYMRPANVFVASFVGASTMNLLEGQIREDQGSVEFVGSDLRLRLPPYGESSRRQWPQEPVLLGLRPEEITLVPALAGDDEPGVMTVEMCEYLGHESYVHLRQGATDITVKTDLVQIPVGQSHKIAPKGPWHLFEPTSGLRL